MGGAIGESRSIDFFCQLKRKVWTRFCLEKYGTINVVEGQSIDIYFLCAEEVKTLL